MKGYNMTLKEFISSNKELMQRLTSIMPDAKQLELELSYFYMQVAGDNKLAECSQSSLIQCLLVGLQAGASFDKLKKHIYLIPKNKTCTIDFTYSFIIKILYENDMLKELKINVVYQNDQFGGADFNNYTVEHKVISFDRGEIVGAYCIIDYNVGKWLEIMTKDDIIPIEAAANKYYKSATWSNFKAEMIKKSILKRAIKYIPIFANHDKLKSLIDADNENYNFNQLPEKAPLILPKNTDVEPVIEETVKNELNNQLTILDNEK
jgi:recombinational DNA repair protein RecT